MDAGSRETDNGKLPLMLEEVALVDAKVAAATGGMKVSWWHAKVASGVAPKPVLREFRCVRWRLADVRAFWLECAAKGSNPATGLRLTAQAARASAAALARSAEQAAEA